MLRFIKENKEGIIIGGIAGYVAGKYFLGDIDLASISQTQSIIDPLISAGKSAIEIAKTKVVIVTTIIGMGIGVIVDNQIKEGWLGRWL